MENMQVTNKAWFWTNMQVYGLDIIPSWNGTFVYGPRKSWVLIILAWTDQSETAYCLKIRCIVILYRIYGLKK